LCAERVVSPDVPNADEAQQKNADDDEGTAHDFLESSACNGKSPEIPQGNHEFSVKAMRHSATKCAMAWKIRQSASRQCEEIGTISVVQPTLPAKSIHNT
jgi:hypothetical protein